MPHDKGLDPPNVCKQIIAHPQTQASDIGYYSKSHHSEMMRV